MYGRERDRERARERKRNGERKAGLREREKSGKVDKEK
jgi:hypothetical protein